MYKKINTDKDKIGLYLTSKYLCYTLKSEEYRLYVCSIEDESEIIFISEEKKVNYYSIYGDNLIYISRDEDSTFLVNLKSKNKRLIYIISPNKAEVHKKTLPFKYKLIDKVVKNKSGLRKYIINFLDKTEIFNFDTTLLMETKENENERMFPRGGIHWNQLGASYAFVGLVEKMNNSGIRIPKVLIKNVTYSNVPTSDEEDYKDLLNVYKSFNDRPYPVVEWEYIGLVERKVNVFGMTTSYTNMIVEQFFRYGMPFQRFKRLYYNQLYSELYYNNGVFSGEKWLPGIQMDQVNYQEILDSYDILIIEHNAGELPQAHMEFVKNFANYLKNIKN